MPKSSYFKNTARMAKKTKSAEGWIKIHRRLKNHWIWKDSEKLKWWIDILLEANHEERKIPIGNTVLVCKRGQTAKSEITWANEWGVDRGRVRRFFKMLEDDEMICLKNEQKTTMITICNYESYQDQRPDNEQQMNSERTVNEQQTNTNKNYKELKELEELYALRDEKKITEVQIGEYQRFKDWLKENAPRVLDMKEPLTPTQYFKAQDKFGKIGYMLKRMHNYEPLLRKNRSTYLTVCNWIAMEEKNKK